MANVTIFSEKDTISPKKAFLCRHEIKISTPIYINSTPSLPAWLRKVSRKPLQAGPALPDSNQPERLPIPQSLAYERLGIYHPSD
jgi:hypothetical protein